MPWKISRNKSFFKANESDQMAFRSNTLNLSIAHVKHSVKLIQLNYASCLTSSFLILMSVLACFVCLFVFLRLHVWVFLKKNNGGRQAPLAWLSRAPRPFCFLGLLRKLLRYHLFFFQTFAMAQVFLLLFGSVFLVLSSSQKMSPKCLELYKRKTNGCSIPFGAWVPYKRTFTSRCYKHDICYTCVRITCFVNINNSSICQLSLRWKPIVLSRQSVNETNLARLKNRSSESLKG